MHIEINAGGLCGIAIAEYQSNMSNLISDAEKVTSSFKAVSNSTYELSGGVGNLQLLAQKECISFEPIKSLEVHLLNETEERLYGGIFGFIIGI